MRLRHTITIVTAATGLVLLTGGPALAGYPPTIGTGKVSKSRVAPGKVVAFCGGGYSGSSRVVIKIDGRYFSAVRTGSGGRFCAAVRMTTTGHHTVSSWGTGSNHGRRTLVALVTVRPRPHAHGATTSAEAAGTVAAPAMAKMANADTSPTGRFTSAELAAMISAGLILTGAATGFRVAARRRE